MLVLATSWFVLFWFQQSQACFDVPGRGRFLSSIPPYIPPANISAINATWDAGNPDRLLVIVIAGGSRGLIYPSYRSLWKAIAERVESFGVHVYLVSLDPNVNETIFENHQLIFRGTDTLVPGVLNETLLALDHIYANNLPGSKAGFVLRTNLSSFWQFNKLLQWLKGKLPPLVAAYIGGSGPGAFPSGAGTLMSVDVCKKMLALPREPLVNSKDPDDVAIGAALKPTPITPMARHDMLGAHGDVKAVLTNPGYYHFRIKSHDELRDIGVMTWMFNEWYEEDKLSAAKTFHWRNI